MAEPLIEIRDLCKSFGKNVVLDHVNLSIPEGQMTTIIGKSGMGKSVLLKHMVGLLQADSGQVLFRGEPLEAMSSRELHQFKRHYSYMFQNLALFDSLTIFENVAMPLVETSKLSRRQIRSRVMRQLHSMELERTARQYPAQLSGGMRKRVALARALITNPSLVLFDEPTTGLDPIRKNSVHSMINEWQQNLGFTGIMVSHEIPDVFYISQRLAMIEEARIVFDGSPEAIEREERTVVRDFIRGVEGLKVQLTGMASRTHMLMRDERHDENISPDDPAALVVLQICDLAEVSRRLGSVVGQRLIQNLARVVRHQLGPDDTCSYRYQSNEVLLILPGVNLEEAHRFCELIGDLIEAEDLFEADDLPRLQCPLRAGVARLARRRDLIEATRQAEADFFLIGTIHSNRALEHTSETP